MGMNSKEDSAKSLLAFKNVKKTNFNNGKTYSGELPDGTIVTCNCHYGTPIEIICSLWNSRHDTEYEIDDEDGCYYYNLLKKLAAKQG